MENSLNNKIHEKINGWLNKLDHFHLQVSLGKMEAKDEYNKQKKELQNYLHEYIQTADQLKNVAKEKAEVIKKSLNELKDEFQKDEETTEKTIKNHQIVVSKLVTKMGEF